MYLTELFFAVKYRYIEIMYEMSTLVKQEKGTTEEEVQGLKRVNFLLSHSAHEELLRLSRQCNQSMTGLIRLGLSLVRVAVEAGIRGERIMLAGPDGTVRREIVLPMS
jgi:hypothetical protein